MRMVRRIYILVFFGISCFSFSKTDSLIVFSDLIFKNETEKSAFLKYSKSSLQSDVIDLFLCPYEKNEGYNSLIAHQKIADCISILKKEIGAMSDSKKVKFIFKYVHNAFFKVYKLNNSFSDIFEKGEYNCVSASALYAIIFKELQIPYQIIEQPEHVFLIAYPQSDKILIETTSPDKGYFKFPESFVEQYLKYMVDSKQISREEFSKSSSSDLFNKFYYSNSGISLIELAGLQYSNYSIYDLNSKNYSEGIKQIMKGYYLNPSNQSKYLLKAMIFYQLGLNDYSSQDQIRTLALLCRFNNLADKEISKEIINNEFLRVINTQLIKNSDYVQFDKSFKLIFESINDTLLKKEIAFDYHYELARLGYNNLQSKSYEMMHLSSAYKLNPKQANLQNLVLGYFSRLIDKSNDPSIIINLMNEFILSFDFLAANSQFNTIRANSILELAYQSLSINQISKGEGYLKEFEAICIKYDSLTAASYYVEKAYSEAASYYYRKGNKPKTRELLKTGLIYAPENFGLRQRLIQVN